MAFAPTRLHPQVWSHPGKAGPPRVRSECFPPATEREALWRQAKWRADYACRGCLPELWGCSRAEVDEWLYVHRPGSRAGQEQWRQWNPQPRRPEWRPQAADWRQEWWSHGRWEGQGWGEREWWQGSSSSSGWWQK